MNNKLVGKQREKAKEKKKRKHSLKDIISILTYRIGYATDLKMSHQKFKNHDLNVKYY